MKKFTLNIFVFVCALFASQTINAQQNVLFEETFAESLGAFVVEGNNGVNNNIWSWDSYTNAALADAYGKIGTQEEVENYLVSPVINLGMNNIVSYDQYNVYFVDVKENIGLYIREEGTVEWTRVEYEIEADNGKLTPTGEIIIPADYNGKNVNFGFKYYTPGCNSSGILSIANFVVKGEPMPAPSGDVIFNETFAEGLGEFVVEGNNGVNDNIWSWDSNTKAAVADAYGKIETNEEVENYLVSPIITLGKDNFASYDQYNVYFVDVNENIGLYIREDGFAEWKRVEFEIEADNGKLANTGDIIIPTEYNNKNVQFGFKYYTPGSLSSGILSISNFVVKQNSDIHTSIYGVIENAVTDNKIYDIQGRRVNDPLKGLHIVNGKKVIIR